MEFIEAKTILSKMKYGPQWFGIDYNMNLYKGCSHGCIYCDSRSNCYQIENFDQVRIKKNAISILEKELASKRKKGVIGIGAMSDTYNPFEQEYEVTRNALKQISKYGFGVSIDTKSDLIIRDIDLLTEIAKKNNVIIKITITTTDDQLSKIIEPHVCKTSRRLKAIQTLSQAGLFVGVLMNPVLPFLTDTEENIKNMVRLAHENGAKFIHTYMSVTLRENQRVYYYQQLDKYYPGLKEQYRKQYGNQYICKSKNAKELYQVFTKECKKYGILYQMKDIINAYQQTESKQQLTLFE